MLLPPRFTLTMTVSAGSPYAALSIFVLLSHGAAAWFEASVDGVTFAVETGVSDRTLIGAAKALHLEVGRDATGRCVQLNGTDLHPAL